jgi:aldose sugar dehydrogenase
MDFDPATGKLWDTDKGEALGDKINFVEPGYNSGFIVIQGIWYFDPLNESMAGEIAPRKPDGLVEFGGRGKYSPPEFTWYQPVGLVTLVVQ